MNVILGDGNTVVLFDNCFYLACVLNKVYHDICEFNYWSQFSNIIDFLTIVPFFSKNILDFPQTHMSNTLPGDCQRTIGLLLFGKLLEPLWGSKELSKFIFIVNFLTSACVFITAIVL